MINVAVIITWPIFNKKGGSEKVLSELSNALCSTGEYNITVYSKDMVGAEHFSFPVDERVKFVPYDSEKSPFYLNKSILKFLTSFHVDQKIRHAQRHLLSMYLSSWKLRRKLDPSLVDVFLCFSPFSTYILNKALFGSEAKRIPVVTMMHSTIESAVEDILPYIKIEIGDVLLLKEFRDTQYMLNSLVSEVKKSKVIQVLRPEFVEITSKVFETSNVVCISNPINQVVYYPNYKSKKIIHVGRLSRVKRQDMLIEAFYLVHKEFPDWTLDLWGDFEDSEYTEEVNNLITKLCLSDVVKLCGSTDNVNEKLKEASIFVFPSEYEGFGLALGEAMAMGLPCVGCEKCPSVNQLIRNDINGFLCEDTPEALASAILKLIKNEDLRVDFGKKAKLGMEGFYPNRVWIQWDKLLRSVLKIDR